MVDYPFAITSEAGAPEEYKVGGSVIAIFKNFDEGRNDFEGEVTEVIEGDRLSEEVREDQRRSKKVIEGHRRSKKLREAQRRSEKVGEGQRRSEMVREGHRRS